MILSIDQGTTGTTVLLFNDAGEVIDRAYREIQQYYPQPSWVEHDAAEIWQTTRDLVSEITSRYGAPKAIGITNQRETVVVWDKKTGEPLHKAIVWQCRRSADFCNSIKASGKAEWIQQKTGLVVDAYFSASKIRWLLEKHPDWRSRTAAGELAFGTIDSWLIWNLTGGEHVTDHTNASRTMLYNLEHQNWDDELFAFFDIPTAMRPALVSSTPRELRTAASAPCGGNVPIAGIAGDQQAALFGQGCVQKGMVKNTYGTGCFMLNFTGDELRRSTNGLLTTMACAADGGSAYALEGSVFMGGAIVQWLRDELRIIDSAPETEAIAAEIAHTGGVYIVPAFVGLGAPYWDMQARGTITGLSRGSGRRELVRAALEAIAYQSKELADLMADEAGHALAELRVDGGATANNFLMQFQADQMQLAVNRPKMVETTAFGAALLAGICVGIWTPSDAEKIRQVDTIFSPKRGGNHAELFAGWQKAVRQARAK